MAGSLNACGAHPDLIGPDVLVERLRALGSARCETATSTAIRSRSARPVTLWELAGAYRTPPPRHPAPAQPAARRYPAWGACWMRRLRSSSPMSLPIVPPAAPPSAWTIRWRHAIGRR